MTVAQYRSELPTFGELQTPCLLLDNERMHRNIARLNQQVHQLGVPLRPHLKTAKCVEIARCLMRTARGPAAVSTLKEAEQFAAAGVHDILYAVGIAADKLDRVLALRQQGIALSVVVDTVEQARAVAAKSREAADRIPTLIEVDSDGHRSGVQPDDGVLLLEIGRILDRGGAELRGVMTHAGGSYDCTDIGALAKAAEQERRVAVDSANTLLANGLPCPVVSVGSTPTVLFARNLDGITEVRAGVFVFFDLVMAGLGVCTLDEIAISVLTTVIGHQRSRAWSIVDAGWMALSRDRGTANQLVDQRYGVVCDVDGLPRGDLLLEQTSQEHGIVAQRGNVTTSERMPGLGSKLRILPNHACATSAQHDRYVVVDSSREVVGIWPRFSGW